MEDRRSTIIINDYSLPKFSKTRMLERVLTEKSLTDSRELSDRIIFWIDLFCNSLTLPLIAFLDRSVAKSLLYVSLCVR